MILKITIMKEMNLFQMEEINAGGQNRNCMILGGIAFFAGIGGFFAPVFWGIAGGATIGATVYGCFN